MELHLKSSPPKSPLHLKFKVSTAPQNLITFTWEVIQPLSFLIHSRLSHETFFEYDDAP